MPMPPFAADAAQESHNLDALFVQAGRRGKPAQPRVSTPDGSSVVAELSQGAGPSPQNAVDLSRRYREAHRLDFEERLLDGFCDDWRDGVLVDRSADERLDAFLQKAKKKLQKATDAITTFMAAALFVSEACGRSGSHASHLLAERCTQRLIDQRLPIRRVTLLGALLGEPGKNVAGAGLARHRALLFKVLTDALKAGDCTLERDREHNTAWNVVRHDKLQHFAVDLMHDPGTLYEAGSSKHKEYLQLLRLGEGGSSPAIANRAELAGHVPRPPWHVEAGELHYGREAKDQLGKGGFGEVYRGLWADTTVAVKVVKDRDPSDYDAMDFILEIALLSRLSHPNVMRFWRGSVELASGNRTLLMVTEYIEKGGLSTLLHGHNGTKLPEPLTVPQALRLCLGIARGLQYLHSCGVLHLDLKSPNILIDSHWTPKLCDFGLAKIKAQQADQGLQTTLRGVSPLWAPPEMFDSGAGTMTEKADVYSYGVVLLEALAGQLPFRELEQRQLPRAKFEGLMPRISPTVPEDCAHLVRDCCAHRPSSRPTAQAVVVRLEKLAAARRLELANVSMPSWLGGREAAEEHEAAARLRESRDRLRAEARDLAARLAALQERARRLDATAGTAVPTEEALPLLSAAPQALNTVTVDCESCAGTELPEGKSAAAPSKAQKKSTKPAAQTIACCSVA